ncbi:hypothetical protein PHMEG_00010023 [Phytophthora megakarya]|uniref:M96 mating-specific protein n=1 Tax=Phytophthora megakarya TaxID=4795 RepID=A0A225WH64_9STRA|nr:hypothetical protein PHMEG_00010023 [Phytophthora megakarya]
MRSPTSTASTAKQSHACEKTSPQLLDIVEFNGLDDLDDIWTPLSSDFGGFDPVMDMVDEDFETPIEFHALVPTSPDSRPECVTCPTSEGEKDASSPNSSAQIVSYSRQPQKQKRRISRKKRIEDLRGLVAALSLQLENIKKSSARHKIVREFECTPSVWKPIATGQLKLRLKAEENNASLRKLLQLRKNEIKNMKRRFKRRTDEEYLAVSILRMPNFESIQDHTRVFADLLLDIDELYVGVEALFLNKGMNAVPCPGQTCQVYMDVTSGVLLEILDKNIVPFSARKTSKAVWKSLENQGNPEAHAFSQNYPHIGNTVTSYAQYVFKLDDKTTHAEEHKVVRRYVNDSHTVFVSRIASKPIGDYGNVRYLETLCLVVKSGKPLVSGQETATIEMHSTVTRFDDDSSVARKFRTGRFTSLAVQGWKNKVSLKKQEVENLLFEDALLGDH